MAEDISLDMIFRSPDAVFRTEGIKDGKVPFLTMQKEDGEVIIESNISDIKRRAFKGWARDPKRRKLLRCLI